LLLVVGLSLGLRRVGSYMSILLVLLQLGKVAVVDLDMGGGEELILSHLPALDVLVQVLQGPLVAIDVEGSVALTALQACLGQHRTYLVVSVRVVFAEPPLRETCFIHALTSKTGHQHGVD
jgi:hypothetical protein